MKNKLFIIFIYVVGIFTAIQGQDTNFDEQSFFMQIHDSYYTLSNTDVKNFSALVTSANFSKFAKDTWNNSEIFPLQLIWFNPDKIYISEKGVPPSKGKEDEVKQLISGVKQQLKGILVDLQRFYFSGLYKSIPEEYKLRHNEEAVQITYETGEGIGLTRVKHLLGLNGLLLGIEILYPSENKMITITPRFRTVKTKWLCEGWKVQTIKNSIIESGFNLKIENRVVNDVWVPTEIIIEVQKADQPGKTFYDVLSMKNYMFNQSIELK